MGGIILYSLILLTFIAGVLGAFITIWVLEWRKGSKQ